MVSRRINEFGLKPIIGDLVLLNKLQPEDGDSEEKEGESSEGTE